MNKKEITTLIILGVILLAGAGVGGFFLGRSFGSSDSDDSGNSSNTSSSQTDTKTNTKTDTKTDDTTEETVKVGKYALKTGKYATADRDSKGNRVVQTVVILRKDGFVSEGKTYKYTITGSRIKLENGMTYQVSSKDAMTLEAGAGVEFKYQGK
jgi:hypothetical protein